MAGRLLDYIAQGLAADLPVAADMTPLIAPGGTGIYYAYDTPQLYVWNGDTIAWDIAGVASVDLADLGDVDFTTPPTDGQIIVWDNPAGTWKPADESGGGGGFDYFAPTHTPPVLSDFTSFHTTGLTDSSYDGRDSLVVCATKGSNFADEEGFFLHRTPPGGGTWEVTTQILPPVSQGSYIFGGISLFNSGNNKAEVYGHGWYSTSNSNRVAIAEMSVVTNSASTWTFNGDASISLGVTTPWWLRVQFDGTNLNFLLSMDGQEWNQVRTETMSSYMGAVTHVGLGIHFRLANSNPPPFRRRMALTAYHWQQTTALNQPIA